ncbi:hypothetical protein ABKN59_001086 [Abortiporus biennis]
MKERVVGKPWSPHEDNLLIQAVAIHGECDNWKTVALSVPGRTNKACRKRWLHSLSPSIKKTAWTTEEDQLLVSLYATHGTKWSLIARSIPGRTDDACSKRYREALDPSLKRDDWTAEEDVLLLNVYARIGGKWGHVGQELNRSGLACRNRWRMLERKKQALMRANDSNMSTPDTNLHQPSLPSVSSWGPPIAVIGDAQFWDESLPDSTTAQCSPFLSHPYAPPDASLETRQEGQSSPPPFRFTSSSLSSALTIAGPSLPVETEPVQIDHDDSDNNNEPFLDVTTYPDAATPATSPLSPRLPSVTLPSLPSVEYNNSIEPGTTVPEIAQFSRYYRAPNEKTVNRRRPDRAGPPPRLSAKLAVASDTIVLAYACGNHACWPSSEPRGRTCYSTSQELSDHWKIEHQSEIANDKPFRCALEECGKGWKSINGLQYHLQVSKAHYKTAISASTLNSVAGTGTNNSAEVTTSGKQKKVHPCPHSGCPNQYKQLSGLRYHLSHGHPNKLPAQLAVLPPELARKVSLTVENSAAE